MASTVHSVTMYGGLFRGRFTCNNALPISDKSGCDPGAANAVHFISVPRKGFSVVCKANQAQSFLAMACLVLSSNVHDMASDAVHYLVRAGLIEAGMATTNNFVTL